MEPLISAQDLTKTYQRGNQTVRALDHVSFEVAEGEFLSIIGPSGSGKSTLLNLLGCMDSPTSGSLIAAGHDISTASERTRVDFRRKYVGFVFQHFGLMPTLTVEENILLPQVFSKTKDRPDIEKLLAQVNLLDRRHHRPAELSGGEMQRTAIARALISNPKILLADEPTGNLDSATARSILQLFQQLNSNGLTIVVVTHNEPLANAARRQISLQDGRIIAESKKC